MVKASKQAGIEQRRARVAEQYAAGGVTMKQLSDQEGVNLSTIKRDLKIMKVRYLKTQNAAMEAFIADKLDELERLKRTYHKKFKESEGDKTQTTDKQAIRAGGVSGQKVQSKEVTTKTDKQVGDPRWLQGVERVIKQECDLVGASTLKIEHSGAVEVTKGYVSISPDDWDTPTDETN